MSLSAEEKIAAYELLSASEKKLVRDLVRKGTRREVDVILELYHYFPGTRLVKNPPRSEPPASRG